MSWFKIRYLHSLGHFQIDSYPWIAALLRDEDITTEYVNSMCSAVLVSTSTTNERSILNDLLDDQTWFLTPHSRLATGLPWQLLTACTTTTTRRCCLSPPSPSCLASMTGGRPKSQTGGCFVSQKGYDLHWCVNPILVMLGFWVHMDAQPTPNCVFLSDLYGVKSLGLDVQNSQTFCWNLADTFLRT